AARFRDFLRCVQPHDVRGYRKQRIGADLDGGYVMLDDFGASRTALSLGVGPEVSWDAAMAARGLRVLQFDHTVECSPLQHSNFVEPAWRKTALAALKKLSASHACIHIHGNNWGSFTVIGGIPFPDVFEATFVRRGDYALTPSTAVFPTELDRPSNPRVSDLYL